MSFVYHLAVLGNIIEVNWEIVRTASEFSDCQTCAYITKLCHLLADSIFSCLQFLYYVSNTVLVM